MDREKVESINYINTLSDARNLLQSRTRVKVGLGTLCPGLWVLVRGLVSPTYLQSSTHSTTFLFGSAVTKSQWEVPDFVL
jgi:hypothetical protein